MYGSRLDGFATIRAMSNNIGSARNNNDGKRKRHPELDVIIEQVQAEDAEERIAAAFEMLLGKRAPDDRPKVRLNLVLEPSCRSSSCGLAR